MNMLTVADVSTKLFGLETHPGLEHVRRYPPTGVTAQRWSVVEAALSRMWEDMSRVEGCSDPDDVAAGLERIDAAYGEVEAFLQSVDEINTTAAKGIAPALRIFGDAVVPKVIVDFLTVSASDPLSLTTAEIDRQCSQANELAAMQANWSQARDATVARLDTLRDARRRAEETRARAEEAVLAGSLPPLTDTESALRVELDALITPDPEALRELQQRMESALQHLRRADELAQGLLDRCTELRGRLSAYEAKAARLGLAEDTDLLSSRRIAAGLLSRKPCDLRALTRTVADYQQILAAKRGQSR
ncbi:hypothetical protein DVS77_19055 [Mycolicibacterium moriokaense]|nr:hypothetical protein DVS77_19055 [Mycolicibacterium moriokaense]